MDVTLTRFRHALLLFLLIVSPAAFCADCVILLHGLARTSSSLEKIGTTLARTGYDVANIDYASREDTIEALAPKVLARGLAQCEEQGAERINIVTHSMGGILVRYYLEHNDIPALHRVVMLAPPNQGSAVVDAFRHVPGYELLNGPAGLQMGTDEDSVPLALGPVSFELGIIAGNRTINFILSQFLENPDDGKVSVVSTRVGGMCAFVEMPVTHAMMMRNDSVIEQVAGFLATGRFSGESAENDLCSSD